jgi:hypothetical protein
VKAMRFWSSGIFCMFFSPPIKSDVLLLDDLDLAAGRLDLFFRGLADGIHPHG